MQTRNERGVIATALGRACAFLVVAALAGCASFENSKPIPPQPKPVSIAVLNEDISAWSDMPIGVYRVPESQVVISGHQKGQAGALLFGLIGLAVVHAGNVGEGQKMVKDAERVLTMRITPTVEQAVREQLADGRLAARIDARPGTKQGSVNVVPVLVMNKVGDNFLPFLVLKVTLPDAANPQRPLWSTRYIAALGEPRPLVGGASWTADNGALLKKALAEDTDRAVRLMLEDIATPLARDRKDLTVVQGTYAFVSQRLQTTGQLLREDDASIVYMPKLGDIIVFTGVNILDKKNIVYRAATKDDYPLKVIDDAPAKK